MKSRIKVLDKGFIEVVDTMGTDESIVQAARVSYGKGTKTKMEDEKLIYYLMEHGHMSPFEQCEIKLHIKLPIFVARHWVRYRTANINEYSARFSEVNNEAYIPLVWRKQNKKNRQGSEGGFPELEDIEMMEAYKTVVDDSFVLYHSLLEAGVSREMARMVLPLCTYTEWYWKNDLRNIFNFLKQRLSPDAQLEIREYAKALSNIVKELYPIAYSAFEKFILES